jgi:hypothetical protein
VAIVDGLITLAQARASIYGDTIATAPTSNDADIEDYIEAATPVIENIVGKLIAGSHTQTFDGGSGALVLSTRFNAVTSVTESGVVISDYFADPDAGIIYAGTTTAGRSFASGNRNIVAVVTVGSATIPANVQLAARELVTHWWRIGRQANRPGVAQAQSAAPEVSTGFAVPRRVIELLQSDPRLPGFA